MGMAVAVRGARPPSCVLLQAERHPPLGVGAASASCLAAFAVRCRRNPGAQLRPLRWSSTRCLASSSNKEVASSGNELTGSSATFLSNSHSSHENARKSTSIYTIHEGDLVKSHSIDDIINTSDTKVIVPMQKFVRSMTRSKLYQSSKFSICCFVGAGLPCSTPMTALAVLNDPSSCTRTYTLVLAQSFHHALSSLLQGLMIADLDPATAKLAVTITGPFLSAFGFLFILRIVMSWYPKLPVKEFPYFIAYAPTEPILSMTRKLIPPLAGVDVTPVVWFGLISFLNEILVGPQGLLVLLSRQL